MRKATISQTVILLQWGDKEHPCPPHGHQWHRGQLLSDGISVHVGHSMRIYNTLEVLPILEWNAVEHSRGNSSLWNSANCYRPIWKAILTRCCGIHRSWGARWECCQETSTSQPPTNNFWHHPVDWKRVRITSWRPVSTGSEEIVGRSKDES